MSSLFGGTAAAGTPTKSLFGSVGTGQPAATGGLFGSSQPQQAGSLFGSNVAASQAQQGSSLFGGPAAAKPAGSLFGGSTANTQPQQSTSLFGGLGAGIQPSQQQQQQQQRPSQPSLFGASSAANNNQPLQGAQPSVSGLFTRSGGLFGNTSAQPAAPASLFGRPATSITQNITGQPISQPGDTLFEKLQSSRIWTENEPIPPQKNVEYQLRTCARKWNPNSSDSPFQTYLYNNVGVDAAPFYRPGPEEDEQQWEDALSKAPSEGLIPVSTRGFTNLGQRIVMQQQFFSILQHRLHEINSGLSELLRRHDLEISARTAECRRRHVRLSQKCLNLATKTQILRNRGYALDAAEEELAQKLRKLEKQVMDPALGGREEEIWARMVSLRERSRILQAELARTGNKANSDGNDAIDEETLKRAKKILEDYDSQLTHLAKELQNVAVDYEEWEQGRAA